MEGDGRGNTFLSFLLLTRLDDDPLRVLLGVHLHLLPTSCMLYLPFGPLPHSGFSWLLTKLMVPFDNSTTSLVSSGVSDNERTNTAFFAQRHLTTSLIQKLQELFRPI